jgi:hypothetical protein
LNNALHFPESDWTDRRAYQKAFLKAIRQYTPEVLERLRDELMPRYSSPALFAAASARLKSKIPPRTPPVPAADFADFKAALDSWAEQFRLGDRWLREIAVLTLDRWKACPADLATLNWAGLLFRPTPLSLDRELTFSDPGWLVESERWPEFAARVDEAFKQRLQEYRFSIEDQTSEFGVSAPPQIKQPEHYRWLALYQVRRMSPAQIADTMSDDEQTIIENTVLKAVGKTAGLIGLTLREPRKGEGKKPRLTRERKPRNP